MAAPTTWYRTAADRAWIRVWQAAGAIVGPLPAEDSADPAPQQWRAFLDRFALWLGVALCAAGLICYVAANWEHLGKFARLAGAQVLLVLATLAAMRLGPGRIAGQAALWLATIALGALLALIGQTYQTGADTWELFALWTALSLPWTVAARNAVQWLTWALLLNIAFGLWLALRPSTFWSTDDHALLWQGLLNLTLLGLWELAGSRWPEFSGHIGRRLLAATAIALLSLAAIDEIFRDYFERVTLLSGISTMVWAAATIAIAVFHGRFRRDLPVLATLALGIIAVATASLSEFLLGDGNDPAGFYFLIAATVVVQATVAVLILRRLARGAAA